MKELMRPSISDIYDLRALGYDTGTKLWTFITGLILAGIVDWVTTIMPVRDVPPTDPGLQGWLIGLMIALVAPTAWLVGRAVRKDWNATVIWGVAILGVVVFQLCVVVWARNHM